MTISAYAREVGDVGQGWSSLPLGQRYRMAKRLDAEDRQAAFDREVADAARTHNVSIDDARDIVRVRRRTAHRRAQRNAS